MAARAAVSSAAGPVMAGCNWWGRQRRAIGKQGDKGVGEEVKVVGWGLGE